jgi:hypothetical protein
MSVGEPKNCANCTRGQVIQYYGQETYTSQLFAQQAELAALREENEAARKAVSTTPLHSCDCLRCGNASMTCPRVAALAALDRVREGG